MGDLDYTRIDAGTALVQEDATPMTIVAGWGLNHVYYYEFDHAPQAEEYFRAGEIITAAMARDIGQVPQRWKLVQSSEWNHDRAARILGRDPVLVR